jgi:hypothetical protein
LAEDLRTPEMVSAWEGYCAHRKAKRSKMTDRAAEIIFKDFRKWGPRVSVVAMQNSIAQGWTGVFAPKGWKPDTNGGGRITPPSERSIALMRRETDMARWFGEMDATVQDVWLADYLREFPDRKDETTIITRKFREWAYDQKMKERAA